MTGANWIHRSWPHGIGDGQAVVRDRRCSGDLEPQFIQGVFLEFAGLQDRRNSAGAGGGLAISSLPVCMMLRPSRAFYLEQMVYRSPAIEAGIFIDMSTIGPVATASLAQRLESLAECPGSMRLSRGECRLPSVAS